MRAFPWHTRDTDTEHPASGTTAPSEGIRAVTGTKQEQKSSDRITHLTATAFGKHSLGQCALPIRMKHFRFTLLQSCVYFSCLTPLQFLQADSHHFCALSITTSNKDPRSLQRLLALLMQDAEKDTPNTAKLTNTEAIKMPPALVYEAVQMRRRTENVHTISCHQMTRIMLHCARAEI